MLAFYAKFFFDGLRHSAATELRTLACVVAADVRRMTGSNVKNLYNLFPMSFQQSSPGYHNQQSQGSGYDQSLPGARSVCLGSPYAQSHTGQKLLWCSW